jgi:addiction module HigA family antidote
MKPDKNTPNSHIGQFLKETVLPKGITVTKAAKLLGVERPTLSNLLNGKASLSPEMALRFEKAFGANGIKKEDLLNLQLKYTQQNTSDISNQMIVQNFVPSFHKITAHSIENWATTHDSRSKLAVLLRKLIHSTGLNLLTVDFPGYDNAERHGWDGQVECRSATSWIPEGNSGWEFGCNKDPGIKAEKDFKARTFEDKTLSIEDRLKMHFIFVTPRNWKNKEKWRQEKNRLSQWKSVRAYDASDLEQWLEQALAVQAWLVEELGSNNKGVNTLDYYYWKKWVLDTPLTPVFFKSAVAYHQNILTQWLTQEPSTPLRIYADSTLEALAFLYCFFNQENKENKEEKGKALKDEVLVFSSGDQLEKLYEASSKFIAVISETEAEQQLGALYKKKHTILIKSKNAVESGDHMIVLDLLSYEAFQAGVLSMEKYDQNDVTKLARESGYSLTVLRRRLSAVRDINIPKWARDRDSVKKLIPLMFAGAWISDSLSDQVVLSHLADKDYNEVESSFLELLQYEDSPVWASGKYKGIVSKIDIFFAIHTSITSKNLDDFFAVAKDVLSEDDPSFDLPENERWTAGVRGKIRGHSKNIRDGICETLVVLSTYIEKDVEQRVNNLIKDILLPFDERKLYAQRADFPRYAEAAPEIFLKAIEDDLASNKIILSLLKPSDSNFFGGGCLRAELLWALELLAWNKRYLDRVCTILSKFSLEEIHDNWGNKPKITLYTILNSWAPQTSAPLEQRNQALKKITKNYPSVGLELCINQFPGYKTIHPSMRPRWRPDASGCGNRVPYRETIKFIKTAFELAVKSDEHDKNSIGSLIESQRSFQDDEYQAQIWKKVKSWAMGDINDEDKAYVKEKVRRFALTKRSIRKGLSPATVEEAHKVYNLLSPSDVVIRHIWLFEKEWIEESLDERETYGRQHFYKREDKIEELREKALREIWKEKGIKGIHQLLLRGDTSRTVGINLAKIIVGTSDAIVFIETSFNTNDVPEIKLNDLIKGFLSKIEADLKKGITENVIKNGDRNTILRFFKCFSFEKETWRYLSTLGDEIVERYWKEVPPHLIHNSDDTYEALSQLLRANRYLEAFQCVRLVLKEIETNQLKALLQNISPHDFSNNHQGSLCVDRYEISEALHILQNRPGVTEEEMALLEFKFILFLDDTKHGTLNLERQFFKSSIWFVQLLSICYKRDDGKEDPSELQIQDPSIKNSLYQVAYTLFNTLKYAPSPEKSQEDITNELRFWVKEVREECLRIGRQSIGDHFIGQVLSRSEEGLDGIWPPEPIREILEEIESNDIAIGMRIGKYNSGEAQYRDRGGKQEVEVANQYELWAEIIRPEYPYIARILESLQKSYEEQAKWWDAEQSMWDRTGV